MRKLNLPRMQHLEVLKDAVHGMHHSSLRERIEAEEGAMLWAGVSYVHAGAAEELGSLLPSEFALKSISSPEAKKYYENRFVAKRCRARRHYDALIQGAPIRNCPYCGVGLVYTLDHYLPKTHFPAIATFPVNLVPACRDCNSEKLEFYPEDSSSSILHPYFDDVDDVRWLQVRIVADSLPVAEYYVAEEVSDRVKPRLEMHLDVLDLRTRFGLYAAQAMWDDRSRLMELRRGDGVDAVRSHLAEQASVRGGVLRNSWVRALYEALASNDWYCDEYLDRVDA